MKSMHDVRFRILAPAILGMAALAAANAFLLSEFQTRVSRAEERTTLLKDYDSYNKELEDMEVAAAALSIAVAARPDLPPFLRAKNRAELLNSLAPLYEQLRGRFNLAQLYVHEARGYVLLRVHEPDVFGDAFVTYRRTILDAVKSRVPVSGVEIDANRLGVRGIAPVFAESELLGFVEIGLNYDTEYLERLKRRTGADYALWLSVDAVAPSGFWPDNSGYTAPLPALFHYARTDSPLLGTLPREDYQTVIGAGEPIMRLVERGGQKSAVLLAPLFGYGRVPIGLVEISRDRSAVVAALRRQESLTVFVALGVSLLALLLVFVVVKQSVLRPLGVLTAAARAQLSGDLAARVGPMRADEFGELGAVFDALSDSLAKATEGLERTVDERTAELLDKNLELERSMRELVLTQQQLIEAEKLAALGHLVAGIVHELNTPLGAIVSADLSLDAVVRRRVFSMLRSARSMTEAEFSAAVAAFECAGKVDAPSEWSARSSLAAEVRATLESRGVVVTTNMVSLAVDLALDKAALEQLAAVRPERVMLVLELADVFSSIRSLNSIIAVGASKAADVVAELRNYLGKDVVPDRLELNLSTELQAVLALFKNRRRGSIDVSLALDPEACVYGSRTRLNKVWINLIDNAFAAIEDRGSVSVELARDNGAAVIRVADTGGGIPADLQPRIFSPFFSTKRPGEGTGLGLNIAKKIVEEHNGTISFVCSEGKTTFTVRLPLSPTSFR